MQKKFFNALRKLTLLLCVSTPLCGTQAVAAPNVIVILSDDQGYADLGVQGVLKDIKTPHLDALAAAGVRCTSGYITAPQCSPSRAGLITGRHQARFGVEEIALCPLPLEEITLAERMRKAGYRTGFVGKWHLDVNVLCAAWVKDNLPKAKRSSRGFVIPAEVRERFGPEAQGFDDFYDGELKRYHANYTLDGKAEPTPRYVDDSRFRVDVQSDAAVAFIEKNHAAPFYLHVGYYAPHVPLEATKKYLDRFPGEMPERRHYALAMMSAIDDGVGRIVAKLKEHGLEEDTVIFFTSDNGAPLKGKKDVPIDKPGGAWDGSLNDPLSGEKGTLLEGGIRVPFVVTWPKSLPAGKVYDRPVSSLDITATAMQVAGLDADQAVDGVNLLPHLRGEASGDPHPALFWRFWGQTAVRAGDWKLVRLDGGASEMLYHLGEDLGEKSNRIGTEPKKAAELRELLEKWESQMSPAKPRGGLNAEERDWFRDQLRK
jgi:arylsulfatase A-like enzyme